MRHCLFLARCAAVTNAARTNLMELSSLFWHGPTLQLFGAPAAMLPRIASNAEVYGHVAAGPLAGVPISGEQQCVLQAFPALQCTVTNGWEHCGCQLASWSCCVADAVHI
jgi:glycerol kinase